jgi:hypothetical protein
MASADDEGGWWGTMRGDELLRSGRGVVSQTSGLDIERAGLTLADQEHEEIATSLLETATSGRGKSREREKEKERGDAFFGPPLVVSPFSFPEQAAEKQKPHGIDS